MWEFVKQIAQNPRNAGQGLSAMLALGVTKDPALAQATFDFIFDGARTQDVVTYARGLQRNFSARKLLAEQTKIHWAKIEKLLTGTFAITWWIQVSGCLRL